MSSIKKILFKNKWLYEFAQKAYGLMKAIISGNLKTYIGGVKIVNNGYARINKRVAGRDNLVLIGENAYLFDVDLRIRGNNNRVEIGENVSLGPRCSFWVEGNGISIVIGRDSTFTHTVEFAAQEDNKKIVVGEDCMFANNIKVRTSDSHPIYDVKTGKRINYAKDVYIGNHVWVAPNVVIMKGAYIEDDVIIGSDTMVNSHIGQNCLATGHPAIVKKSEVEWRRMSILGNIPDIV